MEFVLIIDGIWLAAGISHLSMEHLVMCVIVY